MIWYWVNAPGVPSMDRYLATLPPDLAKQIRLCRYEDLETKLSVGSGTHIFAALDQLGTTGREVVAALHDQLVRSGRCTTLNHPERAWLRFELLERLFAAGINTFRAHRAAAATGDVRFPVFVREETGHNGALTRLLHTPRELAKALVALRARGFPIADLLVVELCDLSDAGGMFRTASAFRVGDHIVPAHLLRGHHWMLKWSESDRDESAIREHLHYLAGNPHSAWLRRIFELAGVDYGRIDYGVGEAALQVWEINLNPTLAFLGGGAPALMDQKLEALLEEGRSIWRGGLREAFRALATEGDEDTIPIRLDAATIARARAETVRSRRRRAAVRLLQGLYRRPKIGLPFRKAYSWLLPRP